MRVFLSSLRCFFFAIRLRRFLITDPTVHLSGIERPGGLPARAGDMPRRRRDRLSLPPGGSVPVPATQHASIFGAAYRLMSHRQNGTLPGSPTPSSHRKARRGAVVASIAALAIIAPVSGANASPARAETISASTSAGQAGLFGSASLTSATYESRLKHWMNVARENHGARRIGVNSCVDGFAESWSLLLATSNSFYHQELGPIMRSCSLSTAGEILARGESARAG